MKYLLYSVSAAQYVDGISVTTTYDATEGQNQTRPKFSTSALMGNALSFASVASLRAFVTACVENLANFEYSGLNYRIDAYEEGVAFEEVEGATDGTEETDSGEGVQDGE